MISVAKDMKTAMILVISCIEGSFDRPSFPPTAVLLVRLMKRFKCGEGDSV